MKSIKLSLIEKRIAQLSPS